MTLPKLAPPDSLAGKVAWCIVVGLILLGGVLLVTHQVWFDNPSIVIGRRMDILGQLLVAIGTATLAIVTWASVYETQQVVSGEDLRFRQSRMPMVALVEMPELAKTTDGKPCLGVLLHNRGDGPAQDIRVAVDATVSLSWQTQKMRLEGGRRVPDPIAPGESIEENVPNAFVPAGSYLKEGDKAGAFILYPELKTPDASDEVRYLNPQRTWTTTTVTIKYTDVFGEEFTTLYRDQPGKAFVRDFEVVRPKAYMKVRKLA